MFKSPKRPCSGGVVPLDWRLALVPVAILTTLAGGTLLVAQVEGDLSKEIGGPTDLKAPDADKPLKLRDLKLPSDIPFNIPPGTEISPDLSSLTLPHDLDLELPDGLDLSGMNFQLPQDFSFQLPEGTQFDASGLKLPHGGSIKLPDGRSFDLPPGTDLSLPPEVIEQLLRQGLPMGTLPKTGSVDIKGLPEGLSAGVRASGHHGGASMRLPAGTRITLPDGRQLPFHPGLLLAGAAYLLPAGTTFDMPVSSGYGSGSQMPLPRPHDTGTTTDGRRPIDTEITALPSRVRKGEPFPVSGYVRTFSGAPLGDVQVSVYMNETKGLPGVLVGSGRSDANGRFTLTVTLPNDKPASTYQLVNHAHAFVTPDGVAYADGWGDPPIQTYAETRLKLDVQPTAGVGAPTTFRGTLLDATGAPVSGVPVTVYVNNASIGSAFTSSTGQFTSRHLFTKTGTYAVDAQFTGNANYEASARERAFVSVNNVTIDMPPSITATRGDLIRLSGQVLVTGSPARNLRVEFSIPGEPASLGVVTDTQGRFTYDYTTSSRTPLGASTITYSLPAYNVVRTQALDLSVQGHLSVAPPPPTILGRDVPITIALLDQSGVPIASQAVEVSIAGPGGADTKVMVTGTDGRADALFISPTLEGTYVARAAVPAGSPVRASPATGTFTLGKLDVTWEVPLQVLRGTTAVASVEAKFLGRPLVGETAVLEFFGTRILSLDANGRAVANVDVGPQTQLGPTTAKLELSMTGGSFSGPPTGGFREQRQVDVVALPRIELNVPAEYRPESGVAVNLTVLDDRATKLPGARVRLTLQGDNLTRTAEGRTDPEGRFVHAFDVPNATGPLRLTVNHPADGHYLETNATRTMSLAPEPVDVGGVLLYSLPVVGAAVAGVGTWYGVRRFRKVEVVETLIPAAAVAAPVAAPLRAADFEMEVGIPPGEPLVWGIGEPLPVRFASDAGGDVALRIGDEERRLSFDARGTASTTILARDEATLRLVARRPAEGVAPIETTVRIVDYRKEIAHEFDRFLDEAREAASTITRQSTPREVEWMLGDRLGAASASPLAEMASVMEHTNYSHHAVSRSHYVRFLRAVRDLRAVLSRGSPAP